jgi:hypothetical protein
MFLGSRVWHDDDDDDGGGGGGGGGATTSLLSMSLANVGSLTSHKPYRLPWPLWR